MNAELLSLLRCLKCRASLDFGNDPPSLRCRDCGSSYPLDGGVPRLAGETYVASFGRQWNRYDVARDGEDLATFAVKTGADPRGLKGKLLLDAGCGGGRYARLAGRYGAKVVGVDLSAAVEKAAALCAGMPDVAIVQADLLDLPLAEGVFDLAFSIGVMHHSPDPRRAFAQVAARVKPGGRLAVWLYRKNIPPQEWINDASRAVTTRMPARVLETFCVGLAAFGGVPGLNRTLNKLTNFSNHPDWTLRVCDNFDWYAPRYQSHHTVEELQGWFRAEGFDDLRVLPPAKAGRVYDWAYHHDLIIGSGVNVVGTRQGGPTRPPAPAVEELPENRKERAPVADPLNPTTTDPGPHDDLLAAALREAEARGESPGKIAMIKVLRERTGLGLKDAKDAVEDYGRRHGVEAMVGSPGSAGGLLLAIAVVVMLAAMILVALYGPFGHAP